VRVLICGSRTWTDTKPVYTILNGLLIDCEVEVMTVIEGGAKGADSIAALWAEQRRHGAENGGYVAHKSFPADWDRYGKRAGYVRNQQMLDEGKPDLVVAFRSEGESKGTDMMIDLARRAGVTTWVVGAHNAIPLAADHGSRIDSTGTR